MKFPATSQGLKDGGYVYDNDANCRGCGEPIVWYITPKGKKMPMSVKNESTLLHGALDTYEPHFATCPNAANFRK